MSFKEEMDNLRAEVDNDRSSYGSMSNDITPSFSSSVKDKGVEDKVFTPTFLDSTERTDLVNLRNRIAKEEYSSVVNNTLNLVGLGHNNKADLSEEDAALIDKESQQDSDIYKIFSTSPDQKDFNEYKINAIGAVWQELNKSTPEGNVSNVLNVFNVTDDKWLGDTRADEYKSSMAEVFGVEEENLNSLVEKFKQGDGQAVGLINKLWGDNEKEFMDWKYGENLWDENTKRELGITELTEGVLGNIKNKVNYSHEQKTSWIEEGVDGFIGGLGKAYTTVRNPIAYGTSIPLEKATSYFTGDEAAKEKGDRFRENLFSGDSLQDKYINGLNTVGDNGLTGNVAGFIGEYAPVFAAAIASGGAAGGAAKSAAERGIAGVVGKGATDKVISNALTKSLSKYGTGLAIGASTVAELIAADTIFATYESQKNGTGFLDEFAAGLIMGGSLWGGFKAIKHTSGATGLTNFTVQQANNIRKTIDSNVDNLLQKAVKAGLPLDKIPKAKESIRTFFNDAYDLNSTYLDEQVREGMKRLKTLKDSGDYSTDQIDKIMKFTDDTGISLKDLSEAGTGNYIRGIEDFEAKASSYKNANIEEGFLDIKEQTILDNIAAQDFTFMKRALSKLEVGKELFSVVGEKSMRAFLNDLPDSYQKLIAIKHFESGVAKMKEIKEFKYRTKDGKNTSSLKINEDKLFASLYGQADDYIPESLFGKIGTGIGVAKDALVNIFTDRKAGKGSTFDNALEQRVSQGRRARFITDESIDIKAIKESSDYMDMVEEVYKSNQKDVARFVSDFDNSLKNIEEYSDAEMTKHIKEFEEVAKVRTYENDYQTALRMSVGDSTGYVHSPEYQQHIEDLVNIIETQGSIFKTKATNAALHSLIEEGETLMGNSKYGYYNNKIVKISNEETSEGFIAIVDENITSHIPITSLGEIPKSVVKQVDQARDRVISMIKQNDQIRLDNNLMDKDMMMEDNYIQTQYVKKNGQPLSNTDATIMRNKLSNSTEFKNFNTNNFSQQNKYSTKTTMKRNHKTSDERDAWFEKNDLDIRTRRDPIKQTVEMASRIQREVKISIESSALRRIAKFSRHTKLVKPKDLLDKDLIKTKEYIKSVYQGLKRARDALNSLKGVDKKMDEAKFKQLIGSDEFIEMQKRSNYNLDSLANTDPDAYIEFLKDSYKAMGKEIPADIKKLQRDFNNYKNNRNKPTSVEAKKIDARDRKRLLNNLYTRLNKAVDGDEFIMEAYQNEIKMYTKVLKDTEVSDLEDMLNRTSAQVDSSIDELTNFKTGNATDADLNDVVRNIGGKIDQIETDLNALPFDSINREFKDSFLSKVRLAKTRYQETIADNYRSISELEANGFVRASDITGQKEFDDIFLDPKEAKAVGNLVEKEGSKTFAEIVQLVQFQRQLIATGDLFLSGKSTIAAYQTGGIGQMAKQAALNTEVIANMVRGNLDGIKKNGELLDVLQEAAPFIGTKHLDASMLHEQLNLVNGALVDKNLRQRLMDPNNFDKGSPGYYAAKSLKGFKTLEEAQFNLMMPFGKAMAHKGMVDDLVSRYDKAGRKVNLQEIKIEASKAIDDMYSGQNWDIKLAGSKWLSKDLMKKAPLMMFASDFLTTKMGQIGRIGDIFDVNSVKGTIARDIALRTGVGMLGVLNTASFAINGHSTFANDNDKWWLLKTGKKDNDGNYIYINMFGITGQSLNLLQGNFASLQGQLSVPLQFGLSFFNKDTPMYKDTENLAVKGLKTVVPMSFGSYMDSVFETYTDHNAYGAMDIKDAGLSFISSGFGFETSSQSGKESRVGFSPIPVPEMDELMFKTIGRMFPDVIQGKITPADTLSILERASLGAGKKNQIKWLETTGLEGDSNFELIQNAVDLGEEGDLKLVEALKNEKEAETHNANFDKRSPKYKSNSKTLSLLIGAKAAKMVKENGLSNTQATLMATQEVRKLFPGEKISKFKTNKNNTVRYYIEGDVSNDLLDKLNKFGIDKFTNLSRENAEEFLHEFRSDKGYSGVMDMLIERDYTGK